MLFPCKRNAIASVRDFFPSAKFPDLGNNSSLPPPSFFSTKKRAIMGKVTRYSIVTALKDVDSSTKLPQMKKYFVR